jgi:hypothetical protein
MVMAKDSERDWWQDLQRNLSRLVVDASLVVTQLLVSQR